MNIIIIGGGVSGIYLSILLKQYSKNYNVTIIEKENKPLKKLLMTGNGRCNLSNKNISMNHYDTDRPALVKQILTFDIQRHLSDLGIYTKYVGDLLYPISEQAKSVESVLLRKIKELDINIHTNEEVLSVEEGYKVYTDKNTYTCDKLVIATGTPAGTKNIMYKTHFISQCLNIPFNELRPSLTKFETNKVYSSLQGVRVKSKVTLTYKEKVLSGEEGEVLFTKYGLSGICIMQLSRYYRQGTCIHIDLLPQYSVEEVKEMIKVNPEMDGFLPIQIAKLFVKEKRNEKDIKDFCFEVKGLKGYQDAQVCMGGYPLKLFTNYLEFKQYPYLYSCGEIMNVTGDCGGYNLHYAFASAYQVYKGIIKC